MNKILIALYFSIVVALSLSARAEIGMQLDVENISLDRNSRVIEIAGRFGIPCVKNPTPQLTTTSEEGVLALSVVGERFGQVCIQVVGPRIAFAVDVKALKFEIEKLGLDSDRAYRIVNKQIGFDEVIDFGSNIMPTRFSSSSVTGKLMKSNGVYFIESANQAVRLNSPFIELDSLVGHELEAFGHQVHSGLSEQSFLLSKTTNSWFIVTGVSITE